jgi:hypothetical protein
MTGSIREKTVEKQRLRDGQFGARRGLQAKITNVTVHRQQRYRLPNIGVWNTRLTAHRTQDTQAMFTKPGCRANGLATAVGGSSAPVAKPHQAVMTRDHLPLIQRMGDAAD